MQCEQLNERLADYWAGTLSERERADVEAHVATCPACHREAAELGETWRALGSLPEEEPSPFLARRVTAMIEAFQDGERTQSAPPIVAHAPRRWWPAPMSASTVASRSWHPAWQLAAAVLLVIAGVVGGRAWPDTAARNEIGELRGELHGMREMMTLALLRQDSAVDRLSGVSWSHQIDRPGSEVLAALLDTLAHDPNVNVRLAAIDALQGFGGEDRVRTELMRALRQQGSPLVQIALIDAMVDLRERRSVDVLRTLAGDQKANEAVRQRARRGLQQLSS